MATLIALAAPLAQAQSMPAYQAPAQPETGFVRIFGTALQGLVQKWEAAYLKHNPGVKFGEVFGGSDAAIGSLQHGTADMAVFGRELELNDYLGFYEVFGYNPLEITIASGTYDVPGGSWAPVVFVNKDNPIAQLSMQQLDGIFGAMRTGGYKGYQWMPEQGRSAKEDIRTWDQLGLSGEWKGKEIQTYGYAAGGMGHFMEIEVLNGSNKWNPNYRQYVENGTKILTADASTKGSGVLQMLAELEKDKYGIAWAGFPQWNQVPQIKGIKALPLGRSASGPFYPPTKAAMTDRTYPLTRSVYIYLNRLPGQPLPPKVKDFLKFVLSAEGQDIVRQHGVYLPLPAATVVAQRAKLD